MRTGLLFVSIQVNAIDVGKVYQFDIPAQSLITSLGDISQTTERLFLFPYDLVETKESKHLYGLYTAQQALDLLLAGTGLQGELSNNKTFMVKPMLVAKKNDKLGIKGKEMKTKKTVLASIFAMLFTSAHAVEVNQDKKIKNDVSEIEVIKVTGIRGSVIKSLNTKRFANSIVDAVSAEDIGKFPDQNVAESLQRITGVSLTRDFGEGERVSIRGTSASQNRTLLNGQAVGSADWWAGSIDSRGFNYTMLPSEIVSGLEVYKSPEADIDE